jgi:hypothetical protein
LALATICDDIFYSWNMKSSPIEKRAAPAAPRFPPVLFVRGRVFLLLLCILWADGAAPAFALDFTGVWDYRLSGGEDSAVRDSLQQRYKVGQGFSLEPTDAIVSNLGISYSWSKAEGRDYSDIITPTGDLSLSNDIFVFGLGGSFSRSRQASKTAQDNSSWEMTLDNVWRPGYWPRLSMHYGETRSSISRGLDQDESTSRIKGSDYGIDLTSMLPVGQFFYGFNQSVTEYEIQQSQDKQSRHYGRYNVERKLWRGRLNVKFSQSGQYESTEFSSLTPGGLFEREFDMPTYAAPESLAGETVLQSEPGLRNKETETILIEPGNKWHLGVSEVFGATGQRVEKLTINIYVLDDDDGSLADGKVDLQWSLFKSTGTNIDEAGTVWEPVDKPYAVNYERDKERFVINITALQDLDPAYQSLKVVVANPEFPNDFILKVRALKGAQFFSESFDNTSYITNMQLKWRIARRLTASSNLILENSDDSSSQRVNGSLGWNAARWVNPSLSFNQVRVTTDLRETLSRSYGFNVPIFPVPNLFVKLYAGQSDNYVDSVKTHTGYNYRVNTSATLYPDLTADLTAGYRSDIYYRLDGSVRDTSKSVAGILTLKARLLSSMTTSVTSSYSKNLEPVSEAHYDSVFDLDYRLSDSVNTGLIYAKYWTGDGADSLQLFLTLAVLRTQKTRVDFRSDYTQRENQNSVETLGLTASWDISRIFTLRSSASYYFVESGTQHWSVGTILYMRF